MNIRNSLKINILITIMIILWASAYVGIRAGLKGYSPGSLALFRYLIASICMLFICRVIPRTIEGAKDELRLLYVRHIKLKDFIYITILGLLGFSIYNVALNYGEITVTAGISSFIMSQTPVIITILAVIFYQERLTFLGWLGIVISTLGILLIALDGTPGFHFDFNLGILYVFIAVISGSVYNLFQKSILRRVHPVEFTALAIWIGTLALFIFLPELIKELPKAPLSATLAVIYIGIFPAAIAYLLWSYILSEIPATKAASYLYFTPMVTTILGWLLLREIPTWLSICGGLIALLGAVMVNRGILHKKM